MKIENNVFSSVNLLKNTKHSGIKEPILRRQPENIKPVNKDGFIASNIFDAEGNRIEKDQERPSHIYNCKGELIFSAPADTADSYIIYDDEGNLTWVNQSTYVRTWVNEENKKAIANGSNILEFPIGEIKDKTSIRDILQDLKSAAKELIENGKTPVIAIVLGGGGNEKFKKFLEYVDEYGDDELKAMFDDESIKINAVAGISYAGIFDVLAAKWCAEKDTLKNIFKSIGNELEVKIDSEKFEKMWNKIYGKVINDARQLSRKEVESGLENGLVFSHEYLAERMNRSFSKSIVDYAAGFYKESGLGSEDFYEKIKSAISNGLNEERNNILRVTNLYKDKGLDRGEFYTKITSAVATGFDEKYLRQEEKAYNTPANLPPKRFRPSKSKDMIQYMRDIYKERMQKKPVDISIFNKEMDKWFSQLEYFINEDLEDSFMGFMGYGNNLKADR